jgi:hypothetical protein
MINVNLFKKVVLLEKQEHAEGTTHDNYLHTGRGVDHNKAIFCEAVNIEGRLKVKSTEKSLYILCKLYCLLICSWIIIMESVVHVNVCVTPSVIYTTLLSPAGVIVTVVIGTVI